MSNIKSSFLTYTQVSQEAGEMVWYSHLLQNFLQFVVVHTVKGFSIVNETEIDGFSGIFLLFLWSNGYWQFDLLFLCIFKIQLKHLKFLVHILLKPCLEIFEHYFPSMWKDCNCALAWTFFGIALLCDCNENWPFPVLWPLLSFPNFPASWVYHFNSVIF